MKTVIINIVAVVIGIVAGSCINMGIIMFSSSVIPPPQGADVTTTEGLKAAMHLFEPKHFIFPFLAHALGTLAGACITVLLATTRKLLFAMVIGMFFLAGGIASIFMLPSPLWYNCVDLLFAYIPMAYLGYLISTFIERKR